MPLTKNFKQTVVQRAQREPAFARALLDEAGSLFLNGDPATARVILRDLVNDTVGLQGLASATERPSKSLHRMLSATGNQAWTIWPPSSTCCAETCRWISQFARRDQRGPRRYASDCVTAPENDLPGSADRRHCLSI